MDTCKTCGKDRGRDARPYRHIKQIKEGDCFSCYHWTRYFAEGRNVTRVITAEGEAFAFHTATPMSIDPPRLRGYNGRLFLIVFFDGTEVTTNDLWRAGNLPDYWKAKYPANARLEIP